MSNRKQSSFENLADTLALRVQELRSRGLLNETATLLSLDYASQFAHAPFLFDMTDGILHRSHCAAVPNGSRSTLYAVWELREGDEKLGCPICGPQLGEQLQIQNEDTSTIFFGVTSLARMERRIPWLRLLRPGLERFLGRLR